MDKIIAILDNSLIWIGSIIGAIIGIFTLYCIIIYLPVVLYTETQCLSKGYPTYKVAVNLNSYCLTLDGAVKVAVDKL